MTGNMCLLIFFNITYGPCQVSAPRIKTSSTHFGNNQEDILFLGISYNGNNSLIIEWGSIYGITYPTVSGSQGGGVDVHIAYHVLSVPTIILIAPDKNIIGQLFLPDYSPATRVIDSMLMAHGLFPAITGQEENKHGQKQNFLIFPNPVKDRATLEL